MVDQPAGLDDHFERLRPPIPRSAGTTPSERYLARLAERAFLDLWSFANPYRDQKLAGGSDGKELCDLLIVCDPHVIIFSEKNIKWPEKPLSVAWSRWFRKAVLDAAKQLSGAERWITTEPSKIYLDSKCQVPLPLDFPTTDRMKVHRVVVVRGAASACKEHFQGGTGSFVIKPDVVGQEHLDAPFTVGDLDPEGGFVHVFDEVALDVLLDELDTITDFTNYLEKRASFVRSGHLGLAHGEEDLFAYYAIRTNQDGDHDFTPPKGKTWEDLGKAVLDGSHWEGLRGDPQYRAKKQADEISYVWDSLIGVFTKHLLDGTSIVLPGYEYSLKNSERAVRFMALESRFFRRNHGRAVIGALEIGRKRDVFFRAMISPENSRNSETGFFFLTLKFLPFMEKDGGYEAYRLARTKYLETYAILMLHKYPYLRRIVGIATEPPGQGKGSSEDNIYAEQQEWDDKTIAETEEVAAALGIMRSLKPRQYHDDEFPEIRIRKSEPELGQIAKGNRKQRRAARAEERKRARR